MELSRSKPLIHSVPSGCTANCVFECIPGCPPACCSKSESPEVSKYTYQHLESEAPAPEMFAFPQPIVAPYIAQPQIYPQEQAPAMYTDETQSSSKNTQSSNMDTKPVSASSISSSQTDSSNFFAPKHCPSACLTHCSPECVRSECCDLD